MAMVTISAANIPEAEGVGTGQTVDNSSATLCRMSLTMGERAGVFEGHAISDTGEERIVRAIGYMKSEDDGWVVNDAGDDAQIVLVVNAATLDFVVTGGAGTAEWIGHLTAVFTPNYAP